MGGLHTLDFCGLNELFHRSTIYKWLGKKSSKVFDPNNHNKDGERVCNILAIHKVTYIREERGTSPARTLFSSPDLVNVYFGNTLSTFS